MAFNYSWHIEIEKKEKKLYKLQRTKIDGQSSRVAVLLIRVLKVASPRPGGQKGIFSSKFCKNLRKTKLSFLRDFCRENMCVLTSAEQEVEYLLKVRDPLV